MARAKVNFVYYILCAALLLSVIASVYDWTVQEFPTANGPAITGCSMGTPMSVRASTLSVVPKDVPKPIPATKTNTAPTGPLKIRVSAEQVKDYQFIMRLVRDRTYVLATLPVTAYYVMKITGIDITSVQIPNCKLNITIGDITWTFSQVVALRFEDVFALAGTNITISADVPPGYISHFGMTMELMSHSHMILWK